MLGRILVLTGLFAVTTLGHAVTVYKYVDANGVVTYTDKAVSGAKVFVIQDGMVERFEQQVKLETLKQKGQHLLQIRNDLYAPIDVELWFERTKNVQTNHPAKTIRRVVPARTTLTLATLRPLDSSERMQYTPKWRHGVGDPGAVPEGYRYALPWQGGPFRISQGANGRYSHFTPKGRYAVDIAMPEGTPIVAARAGRVIKVENSQTGRGSHPSGNFVRVLHDDGTMSVYLHLMRGSIQVQEGQRVRLGQALARSGNTGRSSGPHLHFVVQRNVGLEIESIPFEFSQPVGQLPNFAQGN
ncbi:uncharacterized protein DUF4124 [Azomonas agilis]|uniref:Uncharacterized protein DUF4124 n=1 Tax=Azomonas agilis TaxID=116849 RepID=A0A562I0E8_9GAMM|nr:peptidoglycan DD-metalloendopeptidase family protein [Azomonas agilis]TWH64194.1 uncharacterized protein DUF4124 [Azomonas agilis]